MYAQALEATRGPQMYDLYLAFLGERLGAWAGVHGVDDHGPLLKLKGQGKSLAKQMLQVSSSRSGIQWCVRCHRMNMHGPSCW